MKIDLESMPIALPDGVNYDGYLIATYLVSYPKVIPVPKLAPGLAIEQPQGIGAVARGLHRMAVRDEHRRDELPHRRLIVHHEHSLGRHGPLPGT